MQKPHLLPDVARITFDELKAIIGGLRRDPLAIAASVLEVTRTQVPHGKIGPSNNKFHVWGAGAVVLAALMQPRTPFIGKVMFGIEEHIVNSLLRCVAGLTAEDYSIIQTEEQRHRANELAILRILTMQASLQGDDVAQIYRTLYLLEIVEDNAISLSETSSFDELFKNKFNCSILDYMNIIFGLHTMAAQSNVVDISILYSRTNRSNELIGITQQVLNEHGCHHVSVSTIVEDKYAPFRAEGLVQAFFTQKPYIQLTNELWLLPLPAFTRMNALNGAFFVALELAREEAAREGSSSPAKNRRNTQMGYRFERLVHNTLRTIHDEKHLDGEFQYEKNQTAKSADFISYDPGGSITIIQAKLKRLSPGAFFGFDYSAFEHDAKGILAETIWRSIRFLFRLHKAKEKKRLDDGTEARAERILNAPAIFLLAIVPVMPAVFRLPAFRGLVDAGIMEKLRDEEREWWDMQKPRFRGWHIMDWGELNSFATLTMGKDSLFDQLQNYISELKKKFTSLDNGFFPSFRDWHLMQNSNRQIEQQSIQLRAFSMFIDRLKTFMDFSA